MKLEDVKSEKDVDDFIDNISNDTRRSDSLKLLEMLKKITEKPPQLWGTIIGFDKYHYTYESGREGDSLVIGFSPRKQKMSLYLMDGMLSKEKYAKQLESLGKHRTGKACLYINKLQDVNENILKEILEISYKNMKRIIAEKEGWY